MSLLKSNTYTSEDYWNLPEGERAELIDGKLLLKIFYFRYFFYPNHFPHVGKMV